MANPTVPFNPGKIQINQGTWTETCVVEADLIENQAKYPAIRGLLEYADQRMVTTLLTSGAVTPYGVSYVETKLKKVDPTKKIGNNAYRFDIMGRIQKSTEILAQVGATTTDGKFSLKMKDNHLVPGMVAVFHGNRFQAIVLGQPTGGPGNYIYNFQSLTGELFVWATHVAPQPGSKTAFGSFTAYSEKSLRGYGRSFFPNTYVNHMTIQRKTIAISGGAGASVLWYEYENKNGEMAKGWMYEELAQAKVQFAMENEYHKWFAQSTMKDTNGGLLTRSRIQDPETGLDLIIGDGVEEQIAGGNQVFGSGTNGEATEDDFSDQILNLLKKSDKITGISLVFVTGEDGFNNAQKKMVRLSQGQGIQLFQNVDQVDKVGGADVNVGFIFQRFNVNGNSVVFIKNPIMDDEERFTERGSDGRLLMSSNYYCLTTTKNNRMNVESLSRGAHGFDRSMVTASMNGMTGGEGIVQSEEDAKKYMMLMEDMITVYDSTCCGVIYKSAN